MKAMEFIEVYKASSIGRNAFREKGGYHQYIQNDNLKIRLSQSFDVFLSHSHLDEELVVGVKSVLEFRGYSVFVDWIHNSNFDGSIASSGAEMIKVADYLRVHMKKCRWLFYLHTNSSSVSKWCPWELGYFDSQSHPNEGVYVVPLVTGHDKFKGQEYLALYPVIEFAHFGVTKRMMLNEEGKVFSGMWGNYQDSFKSERWEISTGKERIRKII